MADNEQLEQNKPDSLDLGLFVNNQYVTVKKIGVGGFGTVWQAYDFSLRNFIAIKELLPEYAESKFVEMFYKEALIAKNIIHDNIVRVQHFWQGSNGSFYVVLDYVRGVDLETLIKRCNGMKIVIPWKLATLICMNVLKAIDYANRIARDSITGNSYGIVYRDISPGNVLLSFDGNVKLSDFGIAKTADEIKDSIPQKVITGKYPYMSPEQIKGASDIDHRTDIFSVAVLYYEMLTGQQLYQGSNEEIKAQVLGAKFEPSQLYSPTMPAEIGDIIAKALEKDKDKRYDRAIEMYRDIRRVLKGVETDELTVELSDFILKIMRDVMLKSEKMIENVKNLNIQDIEKNNRIPKVRCNDFIVGQSNASSSSQISQVDNNEQFTSSQNISQSQVRQSVTSEASKPQSEAKGKTVFEEVGDWLFKKFDELKKIVIKLFIAIVLACLLFGTIDVFFMQLTPFGKSMYSKLYPPDVVITTVPAGAVVSMKTKEGEVILNNIASNTPIPVRKVIPRTYIVTALKEGFRPVQRVVQIEQSDKSRKVRKEKIEIMFDFILNVDSSPTGADVYIDGNKFGVTPCKAQLLAGPHTIKLSLAGFDDLGSNAKEAKEGQCSIDFTKTAVEDMFVGVDRKFWTCELKNIDGENIFSVSGALFKRVKIESEPKGMMVHIQGESQPRGNTPLDTSLKVGKYNIRLLDPSARYGEALKEIEVSSSSQSGLFVKMNKIISFRVKSKENPNDTFITKVIISNKDYSVTKDISTSKSIRIALPTGVYNVVFQGDNEYKSCKLQNVDINDTSAVVGELEYLKVALQLKTKSKETNEVLPNTYVWLDKKLIGKTDTKGLFKETFKPGKYEFKLIAKDYLEQIVTIDLLSGRKNTTEIIMVADKPDIIVSTATASSLMETQLSSDQQQRYVDTTKPVVKQKVKKPVVEKEQAKENEEIDEDTSGEQQVVVCLNCGYVNTAPKGKKLRFCVNCAKPLK
ncbi:MAG: serine/threonine-protein kinase [Endomicrobiia bacterium]|nr:serine/threonine protein kinase [Endomicrobiaceae bacterium]MDD3053806.1 serine/threonine protein kinase [Endomicrobiaceae bacterium]MDD3922619.1 serine/threonine protein kinase [Endomicrobiaceae bacterium]